MDDDSPCVLVRADLRPSTYKTLAPIAKERGIEVGELVALLADRVAASIAGKNTATPPTGRRPYKRVTPEQEQQIRELNAQHCTDAQIAYKLGLKVSTVTMRRRALGLAAATKAA